MLPFHDVTMVTHTSFSNVDEIQEKILCFENLVYISQHSSRVQTIAGKKITIDGNKGKVYFGSQILERLSIGEYWNISGVPVLSENVIFVFFRTCWCYSEAYNTGMQKWSSIVQYSCTSIWDFKYTFSITSFVD